MIKLNKYVSYGSFLPCNLLLTSGFVPPNHLDESICSFRDLWCLFSFYCIWIEILVGKQCRP